MEVRRKVMYLTIAIVVFAAILIGALTFIPGSQFVPPTRTVTCPGGTVPVHTLDPRFNTGVKTWVCVMGVPAKISE